jgi:hypothetical protein
MRYSLPKTKSLHGAVVSVFIYALSAAATEEDKSGSLPNGER